MSVCGTCFSNIKRISETHQKHRQAQTASQEPLWQKQQREVRYFSDYPHQQVLRFLLFFFFSYFSMIVLVFCILCFNLCPRTEQLQFPHFPSLSKASGFSLTTPIPRLVSAILQEFAITRRKKKKEKKNRSKQKCAWLCSVLLSPATDVLYTKKHNHSQDASMCTQCR